MMMVHCLPVPLVWLIRNSSFEFGSGSTTQRKRRLVFVCLSSGYHARLRAIHPDFFPSLSDAVEDPQPGFQVEAELCSQLAGLELVQARAGLKFHVRPDSVEPKMSLEANMVYREQEVMEEALGGSAFQGGCNNIFVSRGIRTCRTRSHLRH